MDDQPVLIQRSEHGIARDRFSAAALKVVEGLQAAGHDACVVGGGVRDLLLGLKPKDFDVATSATPEQIQKTFRRARLIGRRFRLAHVRFGREVIEVATFRGQSQDSPDTEHSNGRILRDNTFGSEAEDAVRRDFTLNALMYDPATETVKDYVGGYRDLKDRSLRLIGDPVTRYREDPVRLLRAARFAVKLDLKIEPATAGPIPQMASLLTDIPPARLFEEVLKLFMAGQAWPSFRKLVQFGLWDVLFPGLLDDPAHPGPLIVQALRNTDERVREGKPVTPAFLFAALLWPRVSEKAALLEKEGLAPVEALAEAGEIVLAEQVRQVAIPRRFSGMSKQIWMFQPRFMRMKGKRVMALLNERRFRAAYDFLLLRALEDPELEPVAQWWTEIQELDPEARQKKVFGRRRKGGGGNRRRRPAGSG